MIKEGAGVVSEFDLGGCSDQLVGGAGINCASAGFEFHSNS